jgi:hypothetical protein
MTNQKYDKLKVQLDKHAGLVNRIVNVVNNQGKALDLINQDLAHIRHQLSFEALQRTLTSEAIFRSNHFQLSTEIARIKNALQCAQRRRLSLDFLSSSQLDSLYQTMVKESKRAETEPLVSQPSDLLQLELSYFYMNIPDVSPEHLKTIMADMIKDGLYRPTMNDIIKAHKHMEDLDHHSFRSMVVWIIFAIIIIFLIAFTLYIFHYLYYIRSTIYSVLKLKSRKALYTFFNLLILLFSPDGKT